MLGDDQPINMYHDGTILDGDRRTCEAVDLVYTSDRSPELPRECINLATNQVKNTTDYSTKYDIANCTDQGKLEKAGKMFQ